MSSDYVMLQLEDNNPNLGITEAFGSYTTKGVANIQLEVCYSVTDEWTTDGEPSPAKGEMVMGMSRVFLHQAINHLLYSSATEKTSMT